MEPLPLDENTPQPYDPHVSDVIVDDKCEKITPDILITLIHIGRKVAIPPLSIE